MKKLVLLLVLPFFPFYSSAQLRPLAGIQPAPDTAFRQEYQQAFSEIDQDPLSKDVRALAVDGRDNVWIATRAGVYRLGSGQTRWEAQLSAAEQGPAFDVLRDETGTVWIAAWNGLYQSSGSATAGSSLRKIAGIQEPVAALSAAGGTVTAAGPGGIWRLRGQTLTHDAPPVSRNIREILAEKDGTLWIASGAGLFRLKGKNITHFLDEKKLYSYDLSSLTRDARGRLWIGGLGGLTILEEQGASRFITPRDGLPSVHVQSVAADAEGRIWAGTDKGLARYDGAAWSLRHSRRWLVSDDVRDVAFDSRGTAWVATAGGVSAIHRKEMTLSAKEAYFYRVNLRRHVRAPWLVAKCRLVVPGDTSRWEPVDDDNDGEYTGMYLAMESFKYAVTKDEEARRNARKAFEAMRFLQTVTGTAGFFARTVVPATWTGVHDANRTFSARERAEELIKDARFKPVEQRWRPSKDGKWLWKGDTSSDEVSGHFFGYLFYYLLAADESGKQDVRRHVAAIMDYIIDSGYTFRDIDGRHTRWAVWAPEKLNQDPDWAAERAINSAEVLGFLKITHFMTGAKKYDEAYRNLISRHGYLENMRIAKRNDRSWRTHIDDELLSLVYPGLLLLETDESVRTVLRSSLDHWFDSVRPDRSPYFNFIYNLSSGRPDELAVSLAYLRDSPLDLVNWTVDNTQREDMQRVREPELDVIQTSRMPPPSEQVVVRWDTNPWEARKGDGGEHELDPVYWLLPYWMGRYLGVISNP